jgi:Fe-S oxidoreductase
VVLWADTFNDYFFPETARAAVEVLEDAGFHVEVPRGHLCCGRPLYDDGMLDRAKRYLDRVLGALSEEIRARTPFIVLEPSCCGMAGSFGYEGEAKVAVSVAAGERVLLPKVREVPPTTIVIADGFSCREQIAQETNRGALHLAQVMKMAVDARDSAQGPVAYPERRARNRRILEQRRAMGRSMLLAGAGMVAVGVFLARRSA